MYQLQNYLEMMRDPNRMGPLEAALRRVIRPGDSVLDLGAGTGVLSFVAVDAGASHVFAIEKSPVIEVARQVARANGIADRITFIQGDARTVTPPRRVDCMVGDVRGTLPLLDDNIDLFETVRSRWLRPGGCTVPLLDELHVAPVAASEPHQRIVAWSERRREASYEVARGFAANALIRARIGPGDVLAPSQALGSVHYDLATPGRFRIETSFRITKDAGMTGLGVWFRSRMAPGIEFDTAPTSPPTIYAQAFFPLAAVRSVSKDQEIVVDVSAHRILPEPIWKWTVSTPDKPDKPGWREDHSTFSGTVMGLDGLALLEGSRSPTISEGGMLVREVLTAIDGRKTARTVAAEMASRFPERFRSEDDALPQVLEIVNRYA